MIQNVEYWKNRGGDWMEDQWKTKNHPHRKQIINILRKLQPWNSLLEIGCGGGVNLKLINNKFQNKELSGTDVNQKALDFVKDKLADIKLFHGEVEGAMHLGEYDIILIDAVLLYVSGKDIEQAMKRITHSARKAIILCEWYDNDRLGVIREDHWARNYPKLLKEFGWECKTKKVIWPEKTWESIGKLFVARPSKIGEKK